MPLWRVSPADQIRVGSKSEGTPAGGAQSKAQTHTEGGEIDASHVAAQQVDLSVKAIQSETTAAYQCRIRKGFSCNY